MSAADPTRRRWETDLQQAAAKIPAEWLTESDGFTGVLPDHRDEPVVQLYAGLVQVGYARGWL